MNCSVFALYLVLAIIGLVLWSLEKNTTSLATLISNSIHKTVYVIPYEEEVVNTPSLLNTQEKTILNLRPEEVDPKTIQPSITTVSSIVETTNGNMNSQYDVTLTTQTTFSRYCFFTYLADRWSGLFSVALFLADREQQKYDLALSSSPLNNRIHITVVHSADKKIYPINKLRNIAIDHVTTTHLWLADMDMWPSRILLINHSLNIGGLREALLSLPSSELERSDLAVIVPAFEITRGRECGSFESCARSAARRIPNNKQELKECMEKRICNTFRPKEHLHDYFFKEWYNDDYQPLLTQVKCFKGDTQEPYVMVKKTESLPRFSERFVNYGYNKVQWLEHLRYVGYDYQILTNGFAVDIPHTRSSYWSTFVGQLFGKVKEGERRNIPMKNEYVKFKRELYHNFTSHQIVGKC